MPRDHGRILCAIWRDGDFRLRSVAAQRLYMLLLSQPNVNNAGILPMQVSKWAKGCEDTTVTDIQLALEELAEHRFVFFDEHTEECLVRSYMRNDGVMNHKYIWKNALKCCEAVESPFLRRVLAAELTRTRRADAAETAARLLGKQPDPEPDEMPSESDSNGIETASEPDQNGTSHSNGISITRGKGLGKGKGLPSVVGSVGEGPPSEFCKDHPNDTDRNCFACGQARRTYPERLAKWEAEQRATQAAQRQAAIDDCDLCDEFGDITLDDSVLRCDHKPAGKPRRQSAGEGAWA